jgi:hypothetical protein
MPLSSQSEYVQTRSVSHNRRDSIAIPGATQHRVALFSCNGYVNWLMWWLRVGIGMQAYLLTTWLWNSHIYASDNACPKLAGSGTTETLCIRQRRQDAGLRHRSLRFARVACGCRGKHGHPYESKFTSNHACDRGGEQTSSLVCHEKGEMKGLEAAFAFR